MTPVFVDPSVLLLAVGAEHHLREPCRTVLAGAMTGRLVVNMSVEGGQEFLFHRLRRVGPRVAVKEFDLVDRLVIWHDFDADVLRRSRDLVAGGQARGRDAVHAATALAAGFTTIVSCDADFDTVSGLRRLDPSRHQMG